ncbi:nitrogenase iron-molybdenum cofactor biosynthesis protein NifE [Aneurinibacillus terranovensis]|uniref:nitrogenase iron-molybdenum cofactor biosynthesis protein NifE n=1 Tax=Aneurinibacillus terranovensis TaxID=278991 RepID=UPI0003FDC978|nr:nitrogenase iron-molybdenum cofactor biosynthesis protein NifE [Aneurinibacillus terranovensis]
MKRQVVEAFQESACEHNKPDHKGCPRPKPGEAAGGCSFDGAQITLVPITDAAHLVHGPLACAGNSWEGRGSLSSGPSLYQYGLTTDLSEQDIIFGGENKLRQAIGELVQRFNPPAVFVYSTCVTALIGEDLDKICQSESDKWRIPVIPVNSPGFVGSKNLGNRLAGEALLQYVIGTDDSVETTPYDINVIGEYNIAGEFRDIQSLFDRVGIRVLSKITGDARFHEIRRAHLAKVNMVVCGRALVSMARKMEERYHIPYFEGSFYGSRETSVSLRQIAYLLNDHGLEKRVNQLIKDEEEQLDRDLTQYRQILKGKRAVIYTGGVKSWSVISALQELGIQVVGVGINKSSKEDVSRIIDRVGDKANLIEEGGASQILRTVRDKKADIIVAGGRNMYVALKEQIPFLDINQERHSAYAGYAGLKRLAKHLVHALQHPVWQLVQREGPCEGWQ